ncbi:hypothetical protein PS914_03215 [Pseudomonas fluorescens]|uniref:hypothetical protein n=1 Tax=Pseudomonas fluorescens TaxID=294 RepID=UPI0012430C7E|nr:hypothetical protein [Pseudomonas fluorescens]VVP91973.1 hypothetical protein PS914_03215 [Pseudomonas fluorescens]
MILNLATSTVYYDVHLLTGFIAGQSVVIHNETSSTLYVNISATTPENDSEAVLVASGETYTFSPKTSKLWVKGSTGPIHFETLIDSRSGKFQRVDLSPDLYTSDREGFRRLRVDSGQTGFFEGREFRTFFELNIPSGQSVYIRFVSPIDFILFEQSLTLDAGSVRFTALTGATPAGTWATPLPVIGKNRMVSRKAPYYTPVVALHTGGTASGGTIVELFRVVAATSNAQQQTVLGAASTERGLPAGTTYLRLENFGNGTATGVYSLIWEERP